MPFTLSKPLRFGDCDLTGIAYHPAYFSMLLDVNEAMFTSFDVTWRELMFERRMGLPTVTLHVAFQRPLVMAMFSILPCMCAPSDAPRSTSRPM